MNRDLRMQHIRNEWSVGLVSNEVRLFLGRWALEDAIFPMIYQVGGLLVNRRIRESGVAPVPFERILERLGLYKRDKMYEE